MLSFIFPAFRKDNWYSLHNSLKNSFHGEFELILVGPYEPNFKAPNVRWIEDWGCPTRCQQRGLLAATGDWLCFGWDDGTYCDGSVDNAWEILKQNGFDDRTVVIGKFVEGEEQANYMVKDEYYYIKTHDAARSPYFPEDFMILSTGLISKKLLMEIGGFDCQFETMALSVLDASIRLQFHGCKMILQQSLMMTCTWQPGNSGDHEPVNKAFYQNDMPKYYQKYKNPEFNHLPGAMIIPLDNWKNSPEKWERRFA